MIIFSYLFSEQTLQLFFQLRNRILTILGRGPVLSILTLLTIVGLLSSCPTATANRFALRNNYGTVEARYQLTAYNCFDPTEVQAYSSILARQCSIRATPIQRDRPTKFQLLQKEKKRYIMAYSFFLSRTDIRYNCGVYGHPKLDPIHWSFSVIKRVTAEQCMTWLCTRSYRPAAHSTMMQGRDFEQPIFLDEPTYVSYMVHHRTYTKEPSLPTDQVSETACQGEWVEYEEGHPLNHMVAYYDEVHLRTVDMVVESGKIIDKEHQWSLPCPWEAGQCHAEGRTYIWNITEPDYCQVRLYANISNPDVPQSPHQAEAIVSSEAGEKIWIRPAGPLSQCGRVVTANIKFWPFYKGNN